MLRGIKNLSGLAGSGASLKDAGGAGSGAASQLPLYVIIGGTTEKAFVVPVGITKISAVCIGSGAIGYNGLNSPNHGTPSYISRSGTFLCYANGGLGARADQGDIIAPGGSGGVKHGGGDGGDGRGKNYARAGGAGGYNGKGGSWNAEPVAGGGGGGCSGEPSGQAYEVRGGGVGLWGLGQDGSNETADNTDGVGGSGVEDWPRLLNIGGGVTVGSSANASGNDAIGAAGGGELSWVSGIPVTPGETLQVKAGERSDTLYSELRTSYGAVAIYAGELDFLNGTGG